MGTSFTNDFKRKATDEKSKPLNIVIKLDSVEGRPVVKISDDLTKNTGDPTEVLAVKRRFGIPTTTTTTGTTSSSASAGIEVPLGTEIEVEDA